jgi:lipopolysaccharide transport system permease protein
MHDWPVTSLVRPLRSRAAEPPHIFIRPPGGWPGLGLGELWDSRAILLVLARRALMVRYRQTVIGAAWVIIQPVSLMLVFTIFFGILARLPSDGLPYPVFIFIGLLVWHKVGRLLMEGSTSLVTNSALITKVYFPRAFLPTSIALASLVDLAFGTVALAVLLVIFSIVPGWPILTVPLLLLLAIAAGLGAALWLSALHVKYRDVLQLLPFLLQMWFFSTPIIYSSSIVPEPLRTFYWLNPMAGVVTGLRWAFANAPAPPAEALLIGGTVAVAMLISGYVFFRYREPTFSDVV